MFAGDALPGIRVDVAPAPRAEAMPRMDVALFAGFAERGPCHVAIALSSVAAYEAAFGGDCPLAYDDAGGKRLTGALAASVRAFFSNGGERCWAIRLAETGELAVARVALGTPDSGSRAGRRGAFLLPGLLRRMPGIDINSITPAQLDAASIGSWSDAMQLAARLSRAPIELGGRQSMSFGLRFADRGVLALGDLIELAGGAGSATSYAKVLRVGGGEVLALWVASFARLADSAMPQVRPGLAQITGVAKSVDATLTEGDIAAIDFAAPQPVDTLRRNRWVNFRHADGGVWLRIDTVDGTHITGRAWQQVVSRLPAAPIAAARVTIDIAEYRPGGARVHAGLSPSPEGANAVHRIIDADLFHADPANRTAAIRPGFAITRGESGRIAPLADFTEIAARFGSPAFSAADRNALRSAWLPIGLDTGFDEPESPLAGNGDPLERDGLSCFDERLFLDPRLADLRGPALLQSVADIRDLGEQRLFGIHAAFDIAGDLFPEPSLLAVPDATQPGWTLGGTVDTVPPPRPGAPAQPDWRTHSGGCPPSDARSLAAPDFSGFLDSATCLLAAPTLLAPINPVTADDFTLSWGPQPAGSVVVLEEAAKPDFSDAVDILRAEGVVDRVIPGRAQGVHYYRLHIELDGNVSAYAATAVVLRKARYVAVPADPALLARLHAAMLRIAGANGDFFALLSLPVTQRTAEAAAHANTLATLAPGAGGADRLGSDEDRLLSFGALYHPWLVARTPTGLLASPPDGAVAGLMAARARTRGAWIAPANDPLSDIVGLEPSLPDGDLLTLDRARINMIRHLPVGFVLHNADNLSIDRDWRQINVRRFMILLRRMLLRRSTDHVFEPNGPVLRRATERSLAATLDDLQLNGAFAGATSASSFRVAVRQNAADIDAGRLVVEIGVRPAQSIRFLTLRLVQQGARLTIQEAA